MTRFTTKSNVFKESRLIFEIGKSSEVKSSTESAPRSTEKTKKSFIEQREETKEESKAKLALIKAKLPESAVKISGLKFDLKDAKAPVPANGTIEQPFQFGDLNIKGKIIIPEKTDPTAKTTYVFNYVDDPNKFDHAKFLEKLKDKKAELGNTVVITLKTPEGETKVSKEKVNTMEKLMSDVEKYQADLSKNPRFTGVKLPKASDILHMASYSDIEKTKQTQEVLKKYVSKLTESDHRWDIHTQLLDSTSPETLEASLEKVLATPIKPKAQLQQPQSHRSPSNMPPSSISSGRSSAISTSSGASISGRGKPSGSSEGDSHSVSKVELNPEGRVERLNIEEGRVKVIIDYPANFDKNKPTEMVFYSTPNGSDAEKSYGSGDKLKKQIEALRAESPKYKNKNLVLVVAAPDTKQWQTYTPNRAPAILAELTDHVKKNTVNKNFEISLDSFSGGGYFQMNLIDNVSEIPSNIHSIDFYDSFYWYKPQHAKKILNWLKSDRQNRFNLITGTPQIQAKQKLFMQNLEELGVEFIENQGSSYQETTGLNGQIRLLKLDQVSHGGTVEWMGMATAKDPNTFDINRHA